MSPYNAKSEKCRKVYEKTVAALAICPIGRGGEGHPGVAALAICPIGRRGEGQPSVAALVIRPTGRRGRDPLTCGL